MAWPRCLCLTQPASKSPSAPPGSLCCCFHREMSSQSMQVLLRTLPACPSSGLIENHWPIWHSEGDVPEPPARGHRSWSQHVPGHTPPAPPELCQDTALGSDLNLPAGCSAWQQPRAELGKFLNSCSKTHSHSPGKNNCKTVFSKGINKLCA